MTRKSFPIGYLGIIAISCERKLDHWIKEYSVRTVFIYDLKVVIYHFISRMRTSKKNAIRKIAPRDPQSIVRLLSRRIRQIYRDPRGRIYRRGPLIRVSVILSPHTHAYTRTRTRIHIYVVGTDSLRSHRSYKNSNRTEERTSRIHSAILIARSLVLPGMRKLTFLRIM